MSPQRESHVVMFELFGPPFDGKAEQYDVEQLAYKIR